MSVNTRAVSTWKIGALIGFLTPVVIFFLMGFLHILNTIGFEVRMLAGILDFIAIAPGHFLLIILNRFGIANPGLAVISMFAVWAFIGALIGYGIDKYKAWN